MNRTPEPDEGPLMLAEEVRFTRAIALSKPTREHLTAHGLAVLASWEATSSLTREAATCGQTTLHTEHPV